MLLFNLIYLNICLKIIDVLLLIFSLSSNTQTGALSVFIQCRILNAIHNHKYNNVYTIKCLYTLGPAYPTFDYPTFRYIRPCYEKKLKFNYRRNKWTKNTREPLLELTRLLALGVRRAGPDCMALWGGGLPCCTALVWDGMQAGRKLYTIMDGYRLDVIKRELN